MWMTADKENVVNQDLIWESMNNYSWDKEVFCGDCGHKNGAENITGNVGCFQLSFDKNLVQIIVQEINRYVDQYKNVQGNIFLSILL
jgi:hypothetical protein